MELQVTRQCADGSWRASCLVVLKQPAAKPAKDFDVNSPLSPGSWDMPSPRPHLHHPVYAEHLYSSAAIPKRKTLHPAFRTADKSTGTRLSQGSRLTPCEKNKLFLYFYHPDEPDEDYWTQSFLVLKIKIDLQFNHHTVGSVLCMFSTWLSTCGYSLFYALFLIIVISSGAQQNGVEHWVKPLGCPWWCGARRAKVAQIRWSNGEWCL